MKNFYLISLLICTFLLSCAKESANSKYNNHPDPSLIVDNVLGKEMGKLVENTLYELSHHQNKANDEQFCINVVSNYLNNNGYNDKLTFNSLLKSENINKQDIKWSDEQENIINKVYSICENHPKTQIPNKLLELTSDINSLSEKERTPVIQIISIIYNTLENINNMDKRDGVSNCKDGWSWGSFFCNAAAGGIGAIYGAAVSVLCPPAGVAVAIVASSALSTAIC